ncbi:odorant receptor 124-3 [Danio rerio]|uniref:Olfactory receptor n=1 Tax=Danio rerio TaxID=7955 RepID=Q2PRM1_DANRE|nr:odorant receptor 124-3 [Danio rerio]ABC43246.1 odorant receptor [Danio rerio]|eukprot:NP_001124286.1 odorant receptor, family E, subfamily 124, member 3 [Danio rerio]
MENISSSHILTVTALNDWDWTSRILFFSFALLVYLVTIVLNATMIMIIAFEKALHEPMYIFLCNLCINDLCGITGFYPRALAYLLTERNVISHEECIVQDLVIIVYGVGEFTSLSVMAVDRYIAICRPLHYHSIMSPFTVLCLLFFIWVFSSSVGLMAISLTLKYPICRHDINKLFCEHLSLMKLACKQDFFQGIFNGFLYISMSVLLVFVLFSYLKIILACRKSKVSREKFYSTCMPHLITFLNTSCGISDSLCTHFNVETLSRVVYTFLSIINLTLPPFVNPLIYGIKLGPIRAKIFNIFKGQRLNEL